MRNDVEIGIHTKDIVLHLIEAINREDFATAKALVSSDMKFIGVLGSRDGATAYFQDMEKMKLKYSIKNIIAEGKNVSVLYDVTMNNTTFTAVGWYQVENDQVNWFRVIFDPRPLLEKSSDNKS